MARGLSDFDPGALQRLRWGFPTATGKPGLTAAELARLVGASKAQIVAYENGRTVPDPKRVAELARVLNVPPTRLMRTWNRDHWAVADLRRAAALTAAAVTQTLGVSAKAYRKFEQQGIVPAQRHTFLDDLADLLAVSYSTLDRAVDNIPAVTDRKDQATELVRNLAETYVRQDGQWCQPPAQDPYVVELAGLYGRTPHRLQPILGHLLSELRQRAVLIQREHVVAKYDTDPARQHRARGVLAQHRHRYGKEMTQVAARLEAFHRTGQPSDVWQALVDLTDLSANPAGTWVPLTLLATHDTTELLPRFLVRQEPFGDITAAQLTTQGNHHLRAFRDLYTALYPTVRPPRTNNTSRSGTPARTPGPDHNFTLPGFTERFAVPQRVMAQLQKDADLRGTAEVPLSDTVMLTLGPATTGSVPRPRSRPAQITVPAPVPTDWSKLAPGRPHTGTAAEQGAESGSQRDTLLQARVAYTVVEVIDRHAVGAEVPTIAQETGIATARLTPILAMLCEEDFAVEVAEGVYTPGPALDRLAAPGGVDLQLRHTLSLACDILGAAVYFSRYVDGEVKILQMADGPLAPAVHEWVDFKAAAHASAVGKCLLTQLPPDLRADHLSRHRTARLTRRTITNRRHLIDTLERLTPGQPVYDIREYANKVVCGAVAASTGNEIGSLALSLPLSNAHRLGGATAALTHKAVPVLLALLISRTPLGHPTGLQAGAEPTRSTITPAALRRLRATFRTALTNAQDIEDTALNPTVGPHLATDSTSTSLYLFDAPAAPMGGGAAHPLALPHTYTVSANGRTQAFTSEQHGNVHGRLTIYRANAPTPSNAP
ncbi:helix-turn-helix domain-containing protein [Streptomyces virginiae]|uniref:helix-turn-helix domain-containing protein n=1 Tax=Streptomyces virginiae TaxID=1961 RepID=UPI0036BDF7C9